MDHSKLTKIVVANAVKKGIRDIRNDSDRGVRYMVDLGAHVAKTRVQKEFFQNAQSLLKNPKSVYYRLAAQVIKDVDPKTLETVGMNIGYMSWTYGARIIRQHESKCGYNVPWTIFLNCDVDAAKTVDFHGIVSQGQSMGIFTYFVFVGQKTSEIKPLLSLFEAYPDCAFIVFSNSDSLSAVLCESKAPLFNVMISVGCTQAHFERHVSMLIQNKRLFGVHYLYNDANVSDVLKDRCAKRWHALRCSFGFFVADDNCSEETKKRVSAHIADYRSRQAYPLYVFDLYGDVDYVDRVISTESCMAEIRCDGSVVAGNNAVASVSALTSSLEQILSAAMPRVTYTNP